MNKLLLKKVEDLTLYLIEKDKALKASNERISELEKSATCAQQMLKGILVKLGIK